MISRKELEEYAKLRGMSNIGQAEKDYFQNILLFIIYQNFGSEMVFKGGTALSKCYGMARFSEDLDFTSKKEFDFKVIEEGLKRFKLDLEIEEEKFERSRSYILRITGPRYNGNRNSKCKIILDFSFREEVILKAIVKNIGRFLEEIPSFDVYVMAEEEIFAEKIRAILTRNKARDIYDLNFLIDSGLKINIPLIDKKLEYYGKKFNISEFTRAVKNKKEIWKSELSGLIKDVPDFIPLSKKIISAIKNEM
jgi:predicted nucleotidyltransferase component of viral defense system